MKVYIYILLFATILSSCEDDTFVTGAKESIISITGINSRTLENEPFTGSAEDAAVNSLRVLAFDKNDLNNKCASNKLYSGSAVTSTIQHAIIIGDYKFVFLANEPASLTSTLDAVGKRTDLDGITYPASAFSSDRAIPMIQTLDIQVLAQGEVKVGTAEASTAEVEVNLNRLGARVDVILKAKENLDGLFTGVTLSNLPNQVPLMPGFYTTSQGGTRTFTLNDAAEYFEEVTPTEEGIAWQMKINRIVLPANVFNDTQNDTKAIEFTVHVEGKYHPSCKLKIDSEDYTLPKNARLELTANVKMPLEVSMRVLDWTTVPENWQTAEIRTLNVSQISADITDFNGARISFSSNMPVVRVLENVTYVNGGSNEVLKTNVVFNDLAATADNNQLPSRFYYQASTGSGYMDILADESVPNSVRTYTLSLSAENEDGSNALVRTITVTVNQNGQRYVFGAWGEKTTGYIGAFFKKGETGERIITGQHAIYKAWKAEVPWYSRFKLSSTPSFDPNVGTDNPGNAENYKVEPNIKKYEPDSDIGLSVSGRGRIYFRVGARATIDADKSNEYGSITLTFFYANTQTTTTLYIRQGEDADYVFDKSEAIPYKEYYDYSYKTRSGAKRFSPYNLTAADIRDDNESIADLPIDGGEFVYFPTQAGAFFQWGTDFANVALRRAFNPGYSTSWDYDDADGEYNNTNDNNYKESTVPFWASLEPSNETCPKGFLRPNDGYEDQLAYNGPYRQSSNEETYMSSSPYLPRAIDKDEILASAFRMSLFKYPKAGNSLRQDLYEENAQGVWEYVSTQIAPTYPWDTCEGFEKDLKDNTQEGFYADGFFDRRPIVNDGYFSVSSGNASVAYKGVLFFNDSNNKSLFFPSAGRLKDGSGELENRGSGYYWSSSTGPWYPKANNPAWWLTTNYWHMAIGTTIKSFGSSIRCVAEESVSVN